jgi:coenzyme F420-reducing hydrogenase delta subunit
MVPGRYPERHPLRAEVLPDLCVSCGLCAGSCASLAIGPQARTARHQLASARQLVAETAGSAQATLVIACRNNGGVTDRLRARVAADAGTVCFEVDCAGTLHPATVSYLAGHFDGTIVLGCPPQNCVHREGAMLADARILLERKPAIPGRIARQSVRVLHRSGSEWASILAEIDAVRGPRRGAAGRRGARGRTVRAVAFSAALLGVVAAGSRAPQGAPPDRALLRLGWRLAGQVTERCRELSAEELAKRPVHMRVARECTSEVLTYDLAARVDNVLVTEKRVKSPGLRGDRPLSVEEEVPIAPGQHTVRVTFVPADRESGGRPLSFEGTVRFDRGRVVLVTYDGERLIAR